MSDVVLNEFNGALVQEVTDNTEFLKIHRKKYTAYKILYDALQEYGSASSESSEDGLSNKVQNVLLEHSCAQRMSIESEGFTGESQRLLGIVQLDKTQISFSEGLELAKGVEELLQRKHDTICDTFKRVTGQDIGASSRPPIDFVNFKLADDESTLLEYKRKFIEVQNSYLDNLQKMEEILANSTSLRSETLPKMLDEKVEESTLKSRINALRTRLVFETIRNDIFNETDNSLLAYKEIMKDIKRQQEECQRDVAALRCLLEKYNRVSCKEYDEILKLYIQYKTFLERKQKMFELLK